MAERTTVTLSRHVRRRRPSFVLTSLIDVIFLLVIFFMVSSQIVPFSLLPLGPLAANDGQAAPVASPAAPPPVAVRILGGRVVIGGESVAMADVSAALTDLKLSGVTGILLAPGTAATVQDVVTVMEASKAAGLANVTVLNRSGAPP